MTRCGTACIVSEPNTLTRRAGNSDYLACFARILRGMGFRLHYAFAEARSVSAIGYPDYMESFDGVHVPGGMVFKRRGVVVKPIQLMRAVASRMTGLRGYPTDAAQFKGLWTRRPLPEETARWMGRLGNRLGASLVVANYFNCADAFRHVRPGTTKVILVHDVMAMRERSFATMGLLPDFDQGMIVRERLAFAAADICFTIKEEDAEFIRATCPGTMAVTLPFYISEVEEHHVERESSRAVFVGSANAPNIDAVHWLSYEIWPRVRERIPDANVDIIGPAGDGLKGPRSPGVNVRGFVEDLPASLAAAGIAVVPIRFGSGLKIKTLMGLAHGLPTIATTHGAEGVKGAPKNVLQLADDANSFARAIVEMMKANDLQARSFAARKFIAEHHSLLAGQARMASALEAIPPSGRTSPISVSQQ